MWGSRWRKPARVAFALCAYFVFVSVSSAQVGQGDTGQLATSFDTYLRTQANAGKFSGSALVARGGEILFQNSYGFSDRAEGRRNQLGTSYLLASITKQFTAALILKQIERGRLSLDDTALSFVPGAHSDWGKVTIHHLLNHTSGIIDYLNTASIMNKIRSKDLSPLEIMAYFKKRALPREPGAVYSYTNSGYLILAYILEQLTGQSWESLLHSEIFTPAGMSGAGVESRDSLPEDYASGYAIKKGKWIKPSPVHPSISFGVGSMYSTLADLLAWDRALYSTRVLSSSSIDLMLTPGPGNYGYGVKIEEIEGRRVAFHTGHLNGHANILSRYIDDDAVIVVLGNLASTPVKDISAGMARILFGTRAPEMVLSPGSGRDDEILESRDEF